MGKEKKVKKVKDEMKEKEVKKVKKAKKETVKKEKVKKENVKKIEKNDKEKSLEKKLKKFNTEKIVIASIIIGALVIAFGLFGFYYFNTNAKAVAKFNGGKVTTADFTIYYKVFAPMLTYYGYPEDMIADQIANKAAIDKIILKKAKDAKVKLSDEDKAKVDEIFADEEQVGQFIEQGIDVAKMKQLYYNDYTISAYIEKLKTDAKDEDVLAYIKQTAGEDADLNEYDTSHILFKTIDDSGAPLSDADKAAVRAKAEAALARALNGEDFAALAKELSEDGTKENGGKYLMYMDGRTFTEYTDAVKNLQVGGITTVLVESQTGYHIIKLNAKTENGRAHNDYEREAFVNEDINKLGENENLDIDEEYLKKLVEKITGVKAEIETEEDATTEETGITTETTETENTETTTENAQ